MVDIMMMMMIMEKNLIFFFVGKQNVMNVSILSICDVLNKHKNSNQIID